MDYFYGLLRVCKTRLFSQFWRREGAKGTVIICHGLFDHSGLYSKIVSHLLDAGFSVFIFDFPAHGLSEGDERLVYDFKEYADIFAGCLQVLKKEINGPLFAIGQSTGAATVMSWCFSNEETKDLSRIILLAPLVRTTGWLQIRMTHLLMGKVLKFVPRAFTPNSHDHEFVKFITTEDPLQPKRISVRWVGAMIKWNKSFLSFPKKEIPTLVIQGTGDHTVAWQDNLEEIQKQFIEANVKLVEGAKHHLVNEDDAWRHQVFEHLMTFIQSD